MSDFESQVREMADLYPAPSEEATARGREAVRLARQARPGQVGWRRLRSARRYALAGMVFAAALAAAFGGGLAVASSPATTVAASTAATGPGFLPATGWNVLQTGLTAPPQGPTATAANVAFAATDVSQQSPPTATVAALPANGVLLWAQFMPSGGYATIDRSFPVRTLPLQFADARKTTNPEGFGAIGAIRRIDARAAGYDVDVLIFFGAASPSNAAIDAAREELSRLAVPGCPASPEALSAADLGAAAAYVMSWLRSHYVGRGSDLLGARAKAAFVSSATRNSRIRLVRSMCASQASRLVAVEITLSPHGQANVGRLPLLYFLNKTPDGWSVWREG